MYKLVGWLIGVVGPVALVGDLVGGGVSSGSSALAVLIEVGRWDFRPLPIVGPVTLPVPSGAWLEAWFTVLSWNYWWLQDPVMVEIRYVVLMPSLHCSLGRALGYVWGRSWYQLGRVVIEWLKAMGWVGAAVAAGVGGLALAATVLGGS